jgi:hypothetical protein
MGWIKMIHKKWSSVFWTKKRGSKQQEVWERLRSRDMSLGLIANVRCLPKTREAWLF